MNDWRRYDEVAETYERVLAPMTSQVAEDLVTLARPGDGARVLDVGTGSGVAAEAAARIAGDGTLVVGVDRSQPMLAVARRSRPVLRLAAAEAIALPFRDATFDVVTVNFVLPEFTKYETALFDLLRVLRPSGRLAASTWAAGEDELSATWRSLVEQTVSREMVRSAEKEATPWRERFGDPVRLRDTLHEAGLRKVNVEKRSYRFSMSRDDYIAEQSVRALGRFTRGMLGERIWESFQQRARTAFATRFGERVDDTREVLLAVGTKP